MTHRERFYAVLKGEKIDRIPFFPRIELWWNFIQKHDVLPQEYKNLSMYDFIRSLGFGIYGRKENVISQSFGKVEITGKIKNNLVRTEFHTPLGKVWKTQKRFEVLEQCGAILPVLDYAFKSEKDYNILTYIFQNIRYQPTYGEFLKQEEAIGQDGVSRVLASPCPTHWIMVEWMGYERFFYELYDNNVKLMDLINVLTEAYRRKRAFFVQGPGDLVLTGGNFHTAVTSPPIFTNYFLPYFKKFHRHLRKKGKYPMAHVDGEIGGLNGGLIPLIKEADFQIADALAPKPATSIMVKEALVAWKNRILIWGGLPSSLFAPHVTDSEFDSYVISLLQSIHQGDRFVLGIGDTVPIETDLSRILRLSSLYKKYGCFKPGHRGNPTKKNRG